MGATVKRRLGALAASLCLAVLLASCGSPSGTGTQAEEVTPAASYWSTIDYGGGLRFENYATVRELTDASTVVVSGTVSEWYPTRIVGREEGGDPGVQYYGLELTGYTILAGSLVPDELTGGRLVVEVLWHPEALTADAKTDAIFFLAHKTQRFAPGSGMKDPVTRSLTPPEGEERYYRFVSRQGLLVESPDGGVGVPMIDREDSGILRDLSGQSWSQVQREVSG